MQALARTITAIENSDTLKSLTDAVRAFATPYGYDRFVLYSASVSHEEVIKHLYWVEGDWFSTGAQVDAETYLRRCPVNQHIFNTDQPFLWTKSGPAGEETYRVVSAAQGKGLHGLQVPIFGNQGLKGAMSLGGKAITCSLQTRLALTLIAHAAFHRADALYHIAPQQQPARLSPRELEVIRWIAAGKRQADTALLLRLSERTVENHLRRIRHKLGASTTAEAIRIAVNSGDI